MITIRQRSGQTVILGTQGEKTIQEALRLLAEKHASNPGDEQYIKSLSKPFQPNPKGLVELQG